MFDLELTGKRVLVTGGSDGHRRAQMGRAVSYAACKPNRKAFLNAVKKKKNMVMGLKIFSRFICA